MSKIRDLVAPLLSTEMWTVLFSDEFAHLDEPPVSIGTFDSKEKAVSYATEFGGDAYPPLEIWLSDEEW